MYARGNTFIWLQFLSHFSLLNFLRQFLAAPRARARGYHFIFQFIIRPTAFVAMLRIVSFARNPLLRYRADKSAGNIERAAGLNFAAFIKSIYPPTDLYGESTDWSGRYDRLSAELRIRVKWIHRVITFEVGAARRRNSSKDLVRARASDITGEIRRNARDIREDGDLVMRRELL